MGAPDKMKWIKSRMMSEENRQARTRRRTVDSSDPTNQSSANPLVEEVVVNIEMPVINREQQRTEQFVSPERLDSDASEKLRKQRVRSLNAKKKGMIHKNPMNKKNEAQVGDQTSPGMQPLTPHVNPLLHKNKRTKKNKNKNKKNEEKTTIAKHTTAPDASNCVNDEWMMYVDEQTYGPYSIEDLQLWLNDKSIEPDAFVNNGGEWIAVSDAVEQFSGKNES